MVSYKISCDLEGHIDLWQGQCIFFLFHWLSIHNSVNSLLNYFKLSTVVVKKGTSGWRGIMSSTYLNCNISFINCRINVKVFFFADITSLSFQLRISLLFYVGLSHTLTREIWDIHVTLRSYKISCDLEGHVDLLGQLQSEWIYSFFIVWFVLS